ncbi:DNA translocase FtsK 4TM domain-containing protein [Hydrogenophilus thermoluteolus]|uniref:DNA translocase FtsK 4TM domain-containing protein n=1 Tax=Hydrogenophilus thermoluteolus TaxID=297 RepID=UPI003F67756F
MVVGRYHTGFPAVAGEFQCAGIFALSSLWRQPAARGGGVLGHALGEFVALRLGFVGGTLLLLALFLVGFSLTWGVSWGEVTEAIGRWLEARWQRWREGKAGPIVAPSTDARTGNADSQGVWRQKVHHLYLAVLGLFVRCAHWRCAGRNAPNDRSNRQQRSDRSRSRAGRRSPRSTPPVRTRCRTTLNRYRRVPMNRIVQNPNQTRNRKCALHLLRPKRPSPRTGCLSKPTQFAFRGL